MSNDHTHISYALSGLINYNFHCFRKGIQEVFELKQKLTASTAHLPCIPENQPNGMVALDSMDSSTSLSTPTKQTT